jgi:hydrogenase expression/formation protein HypE
MAVMVAREGLEFHPPPSSDSAPLAEPIDALRRAVIPLRALRDATRGGLAAVLHEWAEASALTLAVEDQLLPVTPEVRGVCELLGLDPIHVANEGTMVVAVPRGESDRALAVLHGVPETAKSVRIGRVEPRGVAAVAIERGTGQRIPLDEPVGAPLPRIC